MYSSMTFHHITHLTVPCHHIIVIIIIRWQVPFKDCSCLHDFLPSTTVFRTLPRRIEADVVPMVVQFDCPKPSPPWSTGSATPLGWETVDGCQDEWSMGWVGTGNVAKQTQPPCRHLRDMKSGPWFVCLTAGAVTA